MPLDITNEHGNSRSNEDSFIGIVMDNSQRNGTIRVRIPKNDFNQNLTDQFRPVESVTLLRSRSYQQVNQSAMVTKANFVIAHYFGTNHNQSIPNVQRGEQVKVFQIMGDTGKYYWTVMGRDPNLRQTDIQRTEVAAKTTLNEPVTDGNSYFNEIDTTNKRVTLLKTSAANGEEQTYTFEVDTDAGTVLLADTHGNAVSIDTQGHAVSLKNGSNSSIRIVGEDILITCSGKIVLRSMETNIICDIFRGFIKSVKEITSMGIIRYVTPGFRWVQGANMSQVGDKSQRGASDVTGNLFVDGDIGVTGVNPNRHGH